MVFSLTDLPTQKRTIKKAGEFYKQLSDQNGFTSMMWIAWYNKRKNQSEKRLVLFKLFLVS